MCQTDRTATLPLLLSTQTACSDAAICVNGPNGSFSSCVRYQMPMPLSGRYICRKTCGNVSGQTDKPISNPSLALTPLSVKYQACQLVSAICRSIPSFGLVISYHVIRWDSDEEGQMGSGIFVGERPTPLQRRQIRVPASGIGRYEG